MKSILSVQSKAQLPLVVLRSVMGLLLLLRVSNGATAEVKNLTVNGGIEDGKARLVFEAMLNGTQPASDKVLFATALEHSISVRSNRVASVIRAKIDVLQGNPSELEFTLTGAATITRITGENLRDWSIRHGTNNTRVLVVRPAFTNAAAAKQMNIEIVMAEFSFGSGSFPVVPLTLLAPPDPSLFHGYVKVTWPPELDLVATNSSGLIPIEAALLPEAMRREAPVDGAQLLAFRFLGSAYSLPLRVASADPDTRRVVLGNFKLTGQLAADSASFTLTASARVVSPAGGRLVLLSGSGIALTDLERHPDWRVRFENGSFVVTFDKPGEFSLTIKFNAAVSQANGWKAVDFRVAASALQPIILQGLAADTQFEFANAARPERQGTDFVSFLPADGAVKLSWKQAPKEEEGKLFYAAEMLSQISVSPGLMRQIALLDGKVMQGELSRVTLLLHGAGEVTRVQGDQVLAWNVEPIATERRSPDRPEATASDVRADREIGAPATRRLVVQFNQPQKDAFALQVQMQTPLGAFPQTADAMQLRPEGATRFAGYIRIVNEGAVRLEVTQATGLSQISPEQFPESAATKAAFRVTGGQRFAYRFSGAEFALRLQADQILPELSVSEVLAYHHGENELSIEAEIELDIREAPLRELLLHVPKGYAIARLNANGMSDRVLSEPADQPDAELRLVFGQPVSGRLVIQLRLERNQALGAASWELPRVEVVKAKSVRGNIGVSSDAGFRLTAERTQALTDMGTAFFPRKLAGIQAAFRLSDAAWAATMRVERLPQTVLADGLHLFSIGEGIAYGSSVMNYVISGAPVSAFRVELSGEYFNVEFTGKDVRNWQKTTNGYVVQLHTPVSGAYTLLATYERPFKAQEDTLTFNGARPLDAQSEQGYTLIVSAYQFQVRPVQVSTGLLPLETGEVPPEYRLFFDAPIIAAYRYTSRPFNLQLALSRLAQGDSLPQVVDRAALLTQISKEGQVVTTVRYFVKNRGNPHFRLTLPAGTELWAAAVNGVAVVPVKDAQANLIPLPQRADPNAVLILDLKLAAKSPSPTRVSVGAPVVGAPVLLAEWKLEPDAGQRLIYSKGSLTPVGGAVDVSGFAGLARMFSGDEGGRSATSLLAALALVGLGVLVWRWASREGVCRFSARQISGATLGVVAVLLAAVVFAQLGDVAQHQARFAPRTVTLIAPVQQPDSTLTVEVLNVGEQTRGGGFFSQAWPVLFALAVWIYGWVRTERESRIVAWLLGWMLVAWAALRWPNGAPCFLAVVAGFLLLHVVIPALWRLWQLPRKPRRTPTPPAESGPAPAIAALLIGLLWLGGAAPARSADFQSAVSQISNLRGGVSDATASRFQIGDTAEYNSALRRSRGVRLLAQASPQNTQAEMDDILRKLMAERERAKNQEMAASNQAVAVRVAAAQAPRAVMPTTNVAARVQPSDSAPSRLASLPKEPPLAESVTQQIRIEDKFALATAKVRWQAVKGQLLPLLFEPAVLTRITYPTNALKLVQGSAGTRRAQQLLAQESGVFDIEVRYQLQVAKRETDSGFVLPTQYGLVNELNLTLVNLDVDVLSPQAVSVRRDVVGSNTVATLVLSPVNDAWITWRPRSRDVKSEKPVFYAEVTQLYVPSAGVIEGAHLVSIRPAQGELTELVFDVPAGATITDVGSSRREEAPSANSQSAIRNPQSLVSLWRFDPDTRKLRVSLNPAQSKPFTLIVRSQVVTGPLPFEQSVGLLSVNGAAGQIGLLGLATGNEVQIDTVKAEAFSPLNLEDFPAEAATSLAAQFPGLTVRRAFRYADSTATASLKASAVEPDVRVETQDTLSLGEDRTVLASTAIVDITRAGIFRLSFVMPVGFDVESISGTALSHWTELKTDAGRVITLNLQGKTSGRQQFIINLAGPGTKATNGWVVPQLTLREAGKQQGTLLIVPEQGMRLQVAARDGVTQPDPQSLGITQKGVLVFRILQTPWRLSLDIEQVDPWIQVTSLQHATVNEAQVKVAANLQYQIENTGLKAFHVFIPTNAESVRFQGDQVADFLRVPGVLTNGLQQWEVKLQRRVIGQYLLQVTYQVLMPEQASETILRGVQAADVNLQRGFVTVQSSGRLQVRVDAVPAALQPTEWQGIPRVLQQNLRAASANFAYRLVEPAFQLTLKLDRHEAAKLLPARVVKITFTSVISDAGVMLTQAKLEMLPGDLPLLKVRLPKDAKFWFAFVNRHGVWPWREQDQILIPLERQSRGGGLVPVEVFYSSQVGAAGRSTLDLNLLAPQFDLPLEDIKWNVYLNQKWKVKHWSGSLQLQTQQEVGVAAVLDLQSYLQNEAGLQREKTQAAEQMLALGNSALEQGDPQQARRAFQAAFGLSTHDNAFNEDARVQLHNLKLQQALVGLNVRQAAAAGDPGALGGRFRDLRGAKEVNYTQQDAKEIIDRNTADDNAAYMRLAERLIQQQDAAVTSPSAIHASIPEQGRLLTFQRAVVVDRMAELRIGLELGAVKAASWGVRILILAATLLVIGAFGWAARAFRSTP